MPRDATRSDRRKRAFPVAAIAVCAGSLGAAGLALYRGEPWQWVGVAVAPVALLGWFGWLYAVDTPRSSPDLPWMVGAAAAGMIVAAAAGPVALALGLIGFAITMAYALWYSRLDRPRDPRLVLGQTLPAFEVQDLEGNPVRSIELRGHPTLVLFYRGAWSPICKAQLRELAARHPRIAERGAVVLCVSPQPAAHSARMAKMFDAPFRFLVDVDGRAMAELELAHPGGVPLGIVGYGADTVMPTLVITDARGSVIFLDQTDNSRVRPDPETYLRVLDALG